MQRVRLKGVQFDTDFRKNELTNYDAYAKAKRLKKNPLKANEVLLFISRSGNQLVWVLNVGEIETKNKNRRGHFGRRMIDTRRWRIEGGCWNPAMLQNYANEVGLELVGFRRFEAKYADARTSN